MPSQRHLLARSLGFRLGRHVKPVRMARPWLHRHLKLAALPSIPDACDYVTGVLPDGALAMAGNDSLGDCVLAALVHQAAVWDAQTGRPVPNPQQQQDAAEAAYAAVTGWNAGDPNSDQGTNPSDAWDYAVKNAVAGVQLDCWCNVRPVEDEVQAALFLFGGAFLPWQLPDAILPQSAGDVPPWVLPSGQALVGDWAPNPDNGHETLLTRYTPLVAGTATWGINAHPFNWPFFAAYCDQAAAALSTAWIEADGLAPNQINLAALRADMPALE